MILQSTDELEDYVGNTYSLVILAAKRARQLKEGHAALSRDSSDNKLSVALREVADHKLQPIAPAEEEIAPAPRDMITSLVTGADFDLDEDLDLDEGDAVDDLAALLVGAADEEEAETEAEAADDDEATPAAAATSTDEDEDDEADEDSETDDADDDEEDAADSGDDEAEDE